MVAEMDMRTRARNDLLNALVELAASSLDEREVAFVLDTLKAATEAGLLAPEDAAATDTLARARLQVLRHPESLSEG